MNPLVSVIIPVYKVEKYLDRCVEGVVGQTYQNLEIILVDDGSPDNCPAMCDEWAKKDSRINVIHKENGGLSDARNAALDIAKGEYVTFVDSDDMVALNMIEIFSDVLKKEHSEIVFSKRYTSFFKKFPPTHANIEGIQTVLSYNALEIMFCELRRWEAWGSLYKKELFSRIRFPKGKLYEDISVIPKIIMAAKTVSLIDAKVYYYYSNPESIMRSGNKNAVVKYDLYEAISQMVALFKKIPVKTARINAIAGIIEELLSRVHLARGNRTDNREFIRDSKKLGWKNLKYILFATKVTVKRKLFMLLVLFGVSTYIFK